MLANELPHDPMVVNIPIQHEGDDDDDETVLHEKIRLWTALQRVGTMYSSDYNCRRSFTSYYDRAKETIPYRVIPYEDVLRTSAIVQEAKQINAYMRCAICLRSNMFPRVVASIGFATDERLEDLKLHLLSRLAYKMGCCDTYICRTCVCLQAQSFAIWHPTSITNMPDDLLTPVCVVCGDSSYGSADGDCHHRSQQPKQELRPCAEHELAEDVPA